MDEPEYINEGQNFRIGRMQISGGQLSVVPTATWFIECREPTCGTNYFMTVPRGKTPAMICRKCNGRERVFAKKMDAEVSDTETNDNK